MFGLDQKDFDLLCEILDGKNIGIDIDDTKTSTSVYLIELFRLKYLLVKEVERRQIVYELIHGRYTSKFVERLYKEDFAPNIKNIPLKDNVKETMDFLYKIANPYIITARNNRIDTSTVNSTIDYYDSLGIQYKDALFEVFDKKEACNQLDIDIFIDDSIYHVDGVDSNGKTRGILFESMFNEKEKYQERLDNWNNFGKVILLKNGKNTKKNS